MKRKYDLIKCAVKNYKLNNSTFDENPEESYLSPNKMSTFAKQRSCQQSA